MAFNIDEFQASIHNRGVMKPNKFQVRFTLPSAFGRAEPGFSVYQAMTRDMEFWCDQTSLPGVVLQTAQVRRYGYGPIEKVPVAPVINDIQLRIIVDGAGANWEVFRRWINKVNNFDSQSGINPAPGVARSEQTNGADLGLYEVSYQSDYSTQFVISTFNEIGGEQKRVVLTNTFPTAVSDIRLDWGDNNNLARFSVNLAVQDWYTELT